MKCSTVLLFFLSGIYLLAATRGDESRLWPGAEGATATEVSKPSIAAKYSALPGDFTVSHYPSVFVFLQAGDKATGAAMVVAPRGGHSHLVMEKEGGEAHWLNSHGIAVVVLKYRLARTPGSKYTLPVEVYADSARAVLVVRGRAKEFGIDTGRLGFIGFSFFTRPAFTRPAFTRPAQAGGEEAAMIGTKFDAGNPAASDPIERVSSRPDINILIYPYYRPGSFTRPSTPLPADASIVIQPHAAFSIPKDAPTVFMVCTLEERGF